VRSGLQVTPHLSRTGGQSCGFLPKGGRWHPHLDSGHRPSSKMTARVRWLPAEVRRMAVQGQAFVTPSEWKAAPGRCGPLRGGASGIGMTSSGARETFLFVSRSINGVCHSSSLAASRVTPEPRQDRVLAPGCPAGLGEAGDKCQRCQGTRTSAPLPCRRRPRAGDGKGRVWPAAGATGQGPLMSP
jgi:hypothetical protein